MILVAGATGMLGGMIALQLLQQGKEVRVLLRHNSPSDRMAQMGLATPARVLLEAGAQPVFGDMKRPETLAAACQGISTVITTANSILRGGEDNIQTVDLDGNRRLIDAAQAAGVGRFIFVSALGADVSSPNPFLQAKAKGEEQLRQSGMDYTILAPDAFFEYWAGVVVAGPLSQGWPITLVGRGDSRHSFVAMRDVAAFAVAAVDNRAASNQRIEIGGPEPVSWQEVVAAFEQVTGRPISVQFVQPGEPVPGVPEAAQPLVAGFEMYESAVDMRETGRIYGVRPTRITEAVAGMLAPR
jgi:uncharacterized protein YbjT (DUF2867 family)